MKRFLLAISACVFPYLSSCELPTTIEVGYDPLPKFGAGVAGQQGAYGEPGAFVAALRQPNATGSARPFLQIGRNSSQRHTFETPILPLYNWRVNISNVTLSQAPSLPSLSTGQNLISGALELILPESEVERLASQNKTLELKLLFTSHQTDNKSQSDDGTCQQLIGGASYISDLLLDFLAVDPIRFSDLPPDSQSNISHGGSSYDPAPVNVSSDVLDLSLSPSSPGVTLDGFYGNDPDLRFLDFNGTASRASINHVFYGNSTAAYYKSLTQILPIVVIERYINPMDALNGTEMASISCIRPKDVAPGSLMLPDDYWQYPEAAYNVSSNSNNTQASAGSGTSAGNINQVSLTLSMVAIAVTVLMQACA